MMRHVVPLLGAQRHSHGVLYVTYECPDSALIVEGQSLPGDGATLNIPPELMGGLHVCGIAGIYSGSMIPSTL